MCIRDRDTRSTPVIQALSSRLKNAKSIKAGFNASYKDAKGKSKFSISGSFILKGEKYVVDMPSQKITNDGKTVYTYLKDNKEIQISHNNASDNPISPARLFSGNIASDYTYRFIEEKTFNGKGVYVIELKPKKNSPFSKVHLYIDKSSNLVSGGNIYEKNGSYYAYSISNISTTASVTDATFKFNPNAYKGVEVIDLR